MGERKKLFNKAREVIKNNLDVCKILMDLNKMKALLTVLVQGDRRIIKRAKYKYTEMFEMDHH
jgi:hypothetical protein